MNYQDLKTTLLAAGCNIQVTNMYLNLVTNHGLDIHSKTEAETKELGRIIAGVWNPYVITKSNQLYKHFTWYTYTTVAQRTITDGAGGTPHRGNARIYTTYNYDDRPGYCIHGRYVGGIGADYMCGRCESGDDDWFISICPDCGDAHIKQRPCPMDFTSYFDSNGSLNFHYRTRAWGTLIYLIQTEPGHWRWQFDNQTSIIYYYSKEQAAYAFEYAQAVAYMLDN